MIDGFVKYARECSGLVIGLLGFALCACVEAHDVDAIQGGLLRDGGGDREDGGTSTAGTNGGGSGTGASGTGASGSGGGGTGQPIFGDASSCAPCLDSMGMSGNLEACCTAEGKCGLDVSPFSGGPPTCVQQNAPGVDDPTCPSYTFGGTFPLTSCCAQDGFCGVRIMQTAPLGCVDPAHLGDLVQPAEGGGTGFFGGMGPGSGNQGRGQRERCGGPLD